jgi:hypothetical protein
MPNVDLLGVFLCGIASMILGALWYSPMLFGKAWQRGVGLSDEKLAAGNMSLIYGLAFLLSLAAAYAFGLLLAHLRGLSHGADLGLWPSVGAGAAVGIFLVAASFGINYLFERRSLGHWLINAGYHAVQFTLFGLIFALAA